MIRTLLLQILIFTTVTAAAMPAQNKIAVDLKVVDSNQKPIPEFEVAIFTHRTGISSWKKGKDGIISIRRDEPLYYHIDIRSVNHIIVRTCDYTPHILKIEHLDKYIQRKISLTKGLSIDLVLTTADGRSIPESLIPMIVFPEYEPRIWMNNQTYDGEYRHRSDYNMHSLFKKKAGHYMFNVSEQSSDIFILIDHPGFLRAFRAGPFTKEDLAGGQLKIELPRPATLEVVFGSSKDSVSAPPYAICRIDVHWQIPESESSGQPVAHIQADSSYLHMQPEYFAPGNYWVSCNTGPADRSVPFVWEQINPAFFRDMKQISLSPGQVEKIVFEYIPYDENGYKGDYNATISILWPDATSAVGVPYTLYYVDQHFGSALIQEGTIPDNGQIELTSLRGGPKAPYFLLQIEKGKLGHYSIQLLGDEKTRQLEYRTAPSEGNIAPNITLLDIFSGENVYLSDYRGKVVFIEFWATWCGPCQRPMAHLCEIQTKKGTDWDGKVVLLAISIDDRKETLINHIQNRGWLAVRHLWCHEGEPGHKSIGAQTYGISGVPTALLINQKGKIVWRGHPQSFNVEVEINKLLETK
jgi:thiol-disulfide isomerase/thioredoxin